MSDAVVDCDLAARSVRVLLGRTEYLAAFDEADHALADHPADATLQWLAILALARAGATDTADERLQRSGLLDRADRLPVALAEDVLALEARIAKDRALAAEPERRPELAKAAAEHYEGVFQRFGRTYTGINAATMWCVAGDSAQSRRLAAGVVRLLDDETNSTAEDYWSAATRAEAELLVGNIEAATAALNVAHQHDTDLASRASTRRQLTLICEVLDLDPSLLDALPVPVVIHYCGHLPAAIPDGVGRLRGVDERRVAREINALIARCGSVIAHGSLAAGGDIMIAEAIQAAGGDLHVVLPFPADEFILTSVAGAGEAWVTRFQECLDRATSITTVTGGRQGNDDAGYAYCSSIAMGGALVQAQFMASRAEQLAVWDGQDTGREAGTAADIRRWHATGLPSTVIPVRSPTKPADDRPTVGPERRVRALLFADIKGFSTLVDRQIPSFVTGVLGPLSAVLDRVGVGYRNGWGDALYVVLDDVSTAADVALMLQEVMSRLDLAALGLPAGLGLRVGVHAGPVFVMHDPVRNETSYFGEHVTRAARIEPVAPPGAVFVTEAFAALLALERPDGFVCEYVGRVPTAKSFGPMPMHLLRRHLSPTGSTMT